MFLLIGSKSRGQHRGKFRGLLKFSLSDEAAIYCYSTEKTKSESQKQERRIGEFGLRDTLMFNGYGDQVAQLYSGMDLIKYY